MSEIYTFYGLKKQYDEYHEIERKLVSEIDTLLKQKSIFDMFLPSKIGIRSKIKDKRNQIYDLSLKMSDIIYDLKDYTTFDSNIILPIVAKYMSDKENEEYVVTKIKECDYDEYTPSNTPIDNSFMITKRYGFKYNVITTKDISEKLETVEPPKYVSDYFYGIDESKYLILNDRKQYTLLNGFSLNKSFIKYPFLLDLATCIIDIKLSNPDIKDIDIYNNIFYEQKKLEKK